MAITNSNPYGRYRTSTFTEVWEDAETFVKEVLGSAFPLSDVMVAADASSYLSLAYYMMYAKYGNSHIANLDENQFKYRVFGIIYQYLPTLATKLKIQNKLRALDLDDGDLFEGAKMIYNHSFNPSTAPSTNTLNELDTINDQNVTKNKRSKLDAYAYLSGLLEDDLWSEFTSRFRKLFITIVQPNEPLLYGNNEEVYNEGQHMEILLGILVGFLIIASIWFVISVVTWGDVKEYEEELNKALENAVKASKEADAIKKDDGGSN